MAIFNSKLLNYQRVADSPYLRRWIQGFPLEQSSLRDGPGEATAGGGTSKTS
jgi:hypothetical protein